MERQLFDKPMDELREAFVLARFAEPAMFGRADVEAWLHESTRTAALERPWYATAFTRLLGKDRNPCLGDTLRTAATPNPYDARTFSTAECRETLDRLTQNFGPETETYAAGNRGLIVVGSKSAVTAMADGGTIDSVRITAASAEDVSRALMIEVSSGGPKAEQALAWLKARYALAIAVERERAERDFDEAVAVSADGTRTVTTKWVVVIPSASGDPAMVYPADAFRMNKIRRAPNRHADETRGFMRMQIGSLAQLADRALGTDIEDAQAFDVCAGSFRRARSQNLFTQLMIRFYEEVVPDVESVFLVSADDCPSPLPEGGREISG